MLLNAISHTTLSIITGFTTLLPDKLIHTRDAIVTKSNADFECTLSDIGKLDF